jgi:hypothetical protein
MDCLIRIWACNVVFAFSLGLGATGAAIAQSSSPNVCVTCEGPATAYSCSMEPGAEARSGRGLQIMCIQEIARRYNHASCSVRRNQVGACNGRVHMLPSRRAEPTGPNDAAAATTPKSEPDEGAPKNKVAPKSSEPKTVLELAKRTADTTEKEIKRSARTVSRAARSTWRCLSSFFSEC